MIAIADSHPVQLVIGELLIQSELACRNRQMTFGVIAHDCIGWATEVRDVLREIATDAVFTRERLKAIAADRHISPQEESEIDGYLDEMQTEATEGRIAEHAEFQK